MSANNYFVQPKAALGEYQEVALRPIEQSEDRAGRWSGPFRSGQSPLAVRVKSVLSEAGVKVKDKAGK